MTRLTLKRGPFIAGCLMVAFFCLLFYSFGSHKPWLLASLDDQVTGAMFRWRRAVPAGEKVVIVDIDEKSLQRVGQWPWPRDILARLVEGVHAAGARVIGFDMVFAEPDRTSPLHYLEDMAALLGESLPRGALEGLELRDGLDHDLIFGQALAGAPVVLGYVFQLKDDGITKKGLRPFPGGIMRMTPEEARYEELQLLAGRRAVLNVEGVAQAPSEGFINVFPDDSGMVRAVPLFMMLDGLPYPGLGLEMARLALGESEVVLHAASPDRGGRRGLLGVSLGGRFIPTDDQGRLILNFRGPAGSFRSVSAVDVLDAVAGEAGYGPRGELVPLQAAANGGEIDLQADPGYASQGWHSTLQAAASGRAFDTQALDGACVLIGTSASGLLDLHSTPFARIFPGVEVQATLVDNLLKADPLYGDLLSEIGLTYTLVIAGGLLLSALLAFSGAVAGGLAGLAVIAAVIVGNYYLFFLNNRVVGVTYALLSLVGIFMVVTLSNYFTEHRKKQFIREAFSHYVSPVVVGELMQRPERLSLSGEQKELTILFSDIRDFTSLSERMEPQRLAELLNRYLSAMSDIILEHGGMVDKYIGDAIVAVWGAPLFDAEHAEHAVQAALAMQARLAELRPEWISQGLPAIHAGIGINTGVVSVGNFGSQRRFDYTVIGDNVNLASRLEGLTKVYGVGILISEFTHAALDGRFGCCEVDLVRVMGRLTPVRVLTPLSSGAAAPELGQETRVFEEALTRFRTRDFDAAGALLEGLTSRELRGIRAHYLERLAAFRASPPPADWDGAFDPGTK